MPHGSAVAASPTTPTPPLSQIRGHFAHRLMGFVEDFQSRPHNDNIDGCADDDNDDDVFRHTSRTEQFSWGTPHRCQPQHVRAYNALEIDSSRPQHTRTTCQIKRTHNHTYIQFTNAARVSSKERKRERELTQIGNKRASSFSSPAA